MVRVHRYARAGLPTSHGFLRILVYRVGDGPEEHLALVGGALPGLCREESAGVSSRGSGRPATAPVPHPSPPSPEGDVAGDDGEPVFVRIHSECFTGEVLGSERCDCRGQLHEALETIRTLGRGVVVYLRQEGRGIGLGNKIRAYHLQDRGADTVDANRLLGFVDDGRRYEVAAAILEDLGVRRVRLHTNNPDKIRALEDAGIEVVERIPALVPVTPHNRRYLETKRDRMKHLLPSPEPGLTRAAGRDIDEGVDG